ncbi:MAG: hypothetical protein SFV22_08575 [Saprospiraceae bacterium]|nr:hypothetical protein [Saprospiraceae bacterium]
MRLFPLLPIYTALLFCACGKFTTPQRDRLAEKAEPYDCFSFQRAYPDRDFDWQGWRHTLQELRQTETAQARGAGCDTYLPAWSQQGPMNVAGRCNTLAVKPDDENTLLAGFAGGGIFKTVDGITNWHPVFDDHSELSIGDITFDPSNPNVVYAGTGDPNMPSNVFNGDGIFKSTDASDTWTRLPNSPTGIVSKILVHPGDPNTLWAATMGNPYVRDNQRGVYKSTDGGQTWQHVLFVSNQAGASDLVMSPSQPQVLFASFWDRIRSNQESVIYGPHARVYKSVDGGETWAQLGGGLPTGVNGRTGLAISQTNPNKVYALYIDSLSTPGSLHKSTDGGATWSPVNIIQLEDACSDFGWYFGKIRLNPNDDEEIYFMAIQMWRKPAGNTGWFNAGSGHADSHDLVFAPSGRRYWANDGGVYRSNPGQSTWTKAKNLPSTQFYRTSFNPHTPDTYWAGAQDNGIQKGSGANPNGWQSVFSADGFRCAFDPNDPEHFWVETQNGAIHETLNNGDSWNFGSTALGTADRTNWDTPFFMSPHVPNRLYAATYRAYAKDGSGGWGTISGDLTDGNIYGARFHNISALNESPLTAGKLAAGTSDGNVWRREPAGGWTNITTGLPDRYVTSVHYSPTQANRIFVSHSGFRDNENIPHIHRSDDNGASWLNISSNLPQLPVNDLYILPGQNDQVIFAATDAGVYFTLNGGASWSRLGGNMPFIPVFDLEVNPAREELVAATFARGIWTMPFDSALVQQAPNALSLAGTVRNAEGEGIVDVQVNGNYSDQSGAYTVAQVPACAPYTLTPYRNDNPLNGLTTYDLVLISQHILGSMPFDSPFKMIAADANKSNSITTFDIVLLRKMILGVDTAFANNTSWRFVPANYTFSNPLNPFTAPFPETLAVQVLSDPMTGLDFTGIKTGDVNNSASPNEFTSGLERSVGEWPLALSCLRRGATTEFIFSANELPLACQFTLQFDPGDGIFERIIPLHPALQPEHFSTARIREGLLGFAWHAPEGAEIAGAQPLFKVVMKQTRSDAVFRLANRPTPSLAYRQGGTAMQPRLYLNEQPLAAKVWPQPFGREGGWLQIPAPEQSVEIRDVQGRLLHRQALPPDGLLFIEAGIFPQPGVYFWRAGAWSGKMTVFD